MRSLFFPSRLMAALGCLLAVLCLSGCEKIESLLGKNGGDKKGGGNVQVRLVNAFAVIDLDEVAHRLKRDASLRQALQVKQSQLNGSLTQVRDQYIEQARSMQQQMGEKPAEEDQRKLAETVNQMNAKLTELQQQAAASLSQEQGALVQRFRNEVLPFAVDIARERGFATILIKNENLIFAYDPSTDITEEVVRRMGTPIVP